MSVDTQTPARVREFAPGDWTETIDVRDFIQRNHTPYDGDSTFLTGATVRTEAMWGVLSDLMAAERETMGGVLDWTSRRRRRSPPTPPATWIGTAS